jgi:catechol 2,3-dioxygenase-like lactoylglutathione lyase family enzyme
MDLSHVRAVASLPVSDVQKATDWYRDHLGVAPSRSEEVGTEFSFGGGTSFFLYPSRFAGTNKATAMALNVEDFDGTIADLRARGVTFEEYDFDDLKTVDGVATNPDGTKSAWFKDPDGNIIGVGTM